MNTDLRLPVGVLTGFLGSGKTTLLKRWLYGASAGETAVLINEFGAVGLDHLLVGRIDADTVLLDSGCICCAIRGELKDALWRLYQRRQRGELPAFQRVVIETTGLAAPGPVIATLIGDARLRQVVRPAFVCTVVDALHAGWQQARHPEWLAQVAAADRLYLSKSDLASRQQASAQREALVRLNPLATIVDAAHAPAPWEMEMEMEMEGAGEGEGETGTERQGHEGPVQGAGVAAHGPGQPVNWLARAIAATPRQRGRMLGLAPSFAPVSASHADALSFCLELDAPLDWCTLTLWLTLLLHRHGDRLLRLKGLVAVAAEGWPQGQPTVLHGMGHLMHAPEHLAEWPGTDRRSRLVFITTGLGVQQVHDSWQSFQRFFASDARQWA